MISAEDLCNKTVVACLVAVCLETFKSNLKYMFRKYQQRQHVHLRVRGKLLNNTDASVCISNTSSPEPFQ